jgi:hypothetical protein
MGQSTDGILFYGYCWDEEGVELWADGQKNEDGDDEDAEERYARLVGVERPTDDYPEQKDKSASAEAVRAAFSAYWDKKRDVCKTDEVEVDSHCSGDDPIPYVAVSASKVTASRGTPERIQSLDVGADWDAKLAAYCALMGITPPQDRPGWWLVSMWR